MKSRRGEIAAAGGVGNLKVIPARDHRLPEVDTRLIRLTEAGQREAQIRARDGQVRLDSKSLMERLGRFSELPFSLLDETQIVESLGVVRISFQGLAVLRFGRAVVSGPESIAAPQDGIACVHVVFQRPIGIELPPALFPIAVAHMQKTQSITRIEVARFQIDDLGIGRQRLGRFPVLFVNLTQQIVGSGKIRTQRDGLPRVLSGFNRFTELHPRMRPVVIEARFAGVAVEQRRQFRQALFVPSGRLERGSVVLVVSEFLRLQFVRLAKRLQGFVVALRVVEEGAPVVEQHWIGRLSLYRLVDVCEGLIPHLPASVIHGQELMSAGAVELGLEAS